ncbi:hypothetical protein CBLAS_1845 [Campylobacter blaseri]|uniref:Tat pathway signal protein n=1 Tax=Campylobacter blaseri TaxID=2042961 RepID=A0A2P8R3M0_9BACT|nr:hypothetical protein [Campylobacter blaseri]PSM53075.1 hypothetical protein CQ405_00545 [Campylobacter blaseri]PSM54542.1 hypothetical protein CRN67_00545 [Campylobacter blaseri]QKF86988.1 hypothetical protein CBLAS_1845 [Campylobacter blaseri]
MQKLSRRNFLKIALATGTLMNSASAFVFDKNFSKNINYTHLFYDESSIISKYFAKKISTNNSNLYGLNGDISHIYTKLLKDISSNSILCGFTSYESFFVISQAVKSLNLRPLHLNIYAINDNFNDLKGLKSVRNYIKDDYFINKLAFDLTNFNFNEKDIAKSFTKIAQKDSYKTTLYSWVITSNKRRDI